MSKTETTIEVSTEIDMGQEIRKARRVLGSTFINIRHSLNDFGAKGLNDVYLRFEMMILTFSMNTLLKKKCTFHILEIFQQWFESTLNHQSAFPLMKKKPKNQ